MLNIEIPTMLFSLSAFVILMLLVSRFALRPMLAVMKKREDHIGSQITRAEKSREEAEKLLKEQTLALTRARKEARDLIEKAKMQKEIEAEAILQKAQERAESIVKEGAQEIQREKEKALTHLRDEVGTLSIALASKVLSQEVNVKKQSGLLESYLEEIGRKV